MITPKNDASDSLVVEHREMSPNGKYELIAYRYILDSEDITPIHVSIIPAGTEIPKYGNYYIGERTSDYVLGGTWNKENNVIFFSNNQYSRMIEYYFVRNRPGVKYSVVVNDSKYGGKYLWSD